MQPGRPQGFAAGDPLVFGLPGNPVSAAVSFEVFVRPALLAMQGRAQLHRRMLRLPAALGWRPPHGRRQYLPILFAEGGVAPATAGGSHLAGALARAEGYAVVPAEVDRSRPATSWMSCWSRERIAAILLAGGRGSRMGGVHKPLLEMGGTTLLDAAIAAARDAGCDPIVAVGDSAVAGAGRPSTIAWVREDPPFAGPVAAILVALPLVTAPRLLVLACDLPRVGDAVEVLGAAAFTGDGMCLPTRRDASNG